MVAAGIAADVLLTKQPAPVSRAATEPATSTSPTPSASATHTNDPANLQDMLNTESAALLAGNEKGWLAPVASSAKSTITEYERIYHNMRAMHVTLWGQIAISSDPLTTTTAKVPLHVEYCVNVPSCDDTLATWIIDVRLISGKATIVGYSMAKADNDFAVTPLPWQVATLTVATGPRVVVAASGNEASHVKSTLPIVKKAAAVADRFALWGKPAVYIIYLADHTEFSKWFSSDASYHRIIGLTMSLSRHDLEVTVVLPDASRYSGPGGLADTIQHEMGHVATLQNEPYDIPNNSFEEGIADYCATVGHPSWESGTLAATRQYIRSGKWSHQIYLTKEIMSSNVITANAAYGIGYLGMKYLAKTYGQDKMLAFFGDVIHTEETLDDASENVFDTPWKTVNAAAVKYVEAEA